MYNFIFLVRAFSEDWLTENIYHANTKIHAKLMKIILFVPYLIFGILQNFTPKTLEIAFRRVHI